MERKALESGQSATEFVLIAPLLFLIIFCVIQLAYAAYAALAVQRAALAVARTVSQGGKENDIAARTRVAVALLPIARLNRQALMTILATRCETEVSPDKSRITARVSYPMPIWVPLAGKIFGEPLNPITYDHRSNEGSLDSIFSILNEPAIRSSLQGTLPRVHWITREESTFNESYPAKK